ncbi:MAG TPA: hypothetical protein VN031_00475 [Candidatus Microsaccharimonas sp.]|nr:hypothetical protein [Candidatus Microsaccharimonas sp.]
MVAGLSMSPVEMYPAVPNQSEFETRDAIQAVKYAGIAWLDCYQGWPELYNDKIMEFVELIRHPEVSFDARLDQYLDDELDLVELAELRMEAARQRIAKESGGAACRRSIFVELKQDIASGMLEEQVMLREASGRSFG